MKKLILIFALFCSFFASAGSSKSDRYAYRAELIEYANASYSYYYEQKIRKLCPIGGGEYKAMHKHLGWMKVTIKSQTKLNYKDRWFYLSAFKDIECK